jgi:cytochrome oxidase Cu insertion factor (SCO1/SenC/PrrC family)
MASLPDPHHRTNDAPTRPLALLTAVVATLALSLVGCGDDDGDAATSTVEAKTEIEGITRDDPLEVGDLTLPEVAPDGTETPFRFTAEPGNLLFVAFGYTNCPDVCPTTLYDIKKAKSQLGDDGDLVQVAFATVDPERDTPEVMNQYLGSFAQDGHPLRTEDPSALQEVEAGFGISSEVVKNEAGRIDVAHTARSFLIDDAGRVVVEWSFGTSPDAMASDIQIILSRQAEAT